MRTSKEVSKSSSKKTQAAGAAASKAKPTKTVEVRLTKAQSVKTEKVEKPEAKALVLTRDLVVNPPEKVLKPFREAAKRNRTLLKAQAQKVQKGKAFLAKQPTKGKKYSMDLRVHAPNTVGYFHAGGMPPGACLARLAAAKGVDLIGVADYYNAQYIDIVQQTLGKEDFRILPGMVVCCQLGSCQEVFLLTLFRDGTPASELYSLLDALDVPSAAYGNREYRLSKSLSETISIIEARGGVIIPSRCDKTPYRQMALPTLIDEFGFHTFDLAHPDSPEIFRGRWPNGEFTFVSFSSATALGQIGNRVAKVRLPEGGFEGIKQLVARRK